MRLGNLKLIEGWLEKKYATANPLDYNEKAILIECLAAVKNTPTIEAKPVRHGQWIHSFTFMPLPKGYIWANCNLCEANYEGLASKANYCPNCGAKMDLKK